MIRFRHSHFKFQILSKLLLVYLFIFSSPGAFSQEKVNLAAGIGIPEFLYGGLRFQFRQIQIGGTVGTFPANDEKLFTLSGDLFFHFAGKSQFSERRPTYFRTGVVYLKEETSSKIDKYTYLNLRIGRDLNISKKFGFNIDGGVIIELSHEETVIGPDNNFFNFDFEAPVIPSASLGLFYRL